MNNLVYWPFVTYLTYAYLPLEARIVAFSFAGLIWNIYISYVQFNQQQKIKIENELK